MKRPVLLLSAVAVATTLLADDLDTRAIELLGNRWAVSAITARPTANAQTTRLTTDDSKATIVNVSSGSNRGFVIFDTSNDRVIGYSDDSSVTDCGEIPPALSAMLSAGGDVSNSYPVSVEPVEPLLTTRWGQTAPYNDLCPNSQGSRSVAGCTSVAVAQIVKYYGCDARSPYSIEYHDDSSGQDITVNYDTSYDFANMLDEYPFRKYNETQASAVAKLIFNAGAACKTQYKGETATGIWPLVALTRYFGMMAQGYIRKEMPTDYWIQKIYDELAAGRPILYSGIGYENSRQVSHAFVIDGNDSDGLVHINWGWLGSCNGYYDVNYCAPEGYDRLDGYLRNQQMIAGIRPRTEADGPICNGYMAAGASSWDSMRVSGFTTNNYEGDTDGSKVVWYNPDNGKMLDAGTLANTSVSPVFPNWTLGTFSLPATAPTGLYLLRTAMQDTATGQWYTYDMPLRPYMVSNDDCFVSSHGYMDYDKPIKAPYDQPRLRIDNFELLTDVITGVPFFAHIDTQSLINDPGGMTVSALLCFTNNDSGKKYISDYITLYNEYHNGLRASEDIAVESVSNTDNGFAMPGGTYTLSFADTNSGEESNNVILDKPVTVTVRDRVSYPILRYQYGDKALYIPKTELTFRQDQQLSFWLKSGLNHIIDANNAYTPVTATIYACPVEDTTLASEVLIGTFESNFFVSATSNVMYTEGNLYPLQGTYMVYMRYMTPDGERDFLPRTWYTRHQATGLPMSPTIVTITPSETILDNITVSNVSGSASASQVTFDVRNGADSDFDGTITIDVYDKAHGTVSKLSTSAVTIKAGGEAHLSVDMTIDPATDYDLYFRSVSAYRKPTLARRTDGTVAHYILDLDNSSVEAVTADSATGICVDGLTVRYSAEGGRATVYDCSGRHISHISSGGSATLAPGTYIISTPAGTTRVVLR